MLEVVKERDDARKAPSRKAVRLAENRPLKQAERIEQPVIAYLHIFPFFVVDDYDATRRAAWEIPKADFLKNTLPGGRKIFLKADPAQAFGHLLGGITFAEVICLPQKGKLHPPPSTP